MQGGGCPGPEGLGHFLWEGVKISVSYLSAHMTSPFAQDGVLPICSQMASSEKSLIGEPLGTGRKESVTATLTEQDIGKVVKGGKIASMPSGIIFSFTGTSLMFANNWNCCRNTTFCHLTFIRKVWTIKLLRRVLM